MMRNTSNKESVGSVLIVGSSGSRVKLVRKAIEKYRCPQAEKNSSAGPSLNPTPSRLTIERANSAAIDDVVAQFNALSKCLACIIVESDPAAKSKKKSDAAPITEEIAGLIQSAIRKQSNGATFVAILAASEDAYSAVKSQSLIELGAHMVSAYPATIAKSVHIVASCVRDEGEYACPYCGLDKLTEDGLWYHLPMYHCRERNAKALCPICKADIQGPFQVHVRNKHGPCGRKEIHAESQDAAQLYAFALVVVRRKDGKFLLVHEVAQWGWWLPGGRIDPGEGFIQAAERETLEEAGVDITINGVLRVEFSPGADMCRMRVIFYAVPKDELHAEPKTEPDYESVGAAWVSYEDLRKLPMRGPEPNEWFAYVLKGGAIYPLSLLTPENAPVVVHG